jgi:hypothetical protein
MTLTEKAFATRGLQAMLQHQHRVAAEQQEKDIQLQWREAASRRAQCGSQGMCRIKTRP